MTDGNFLKAVRSSNCLVTIYVKLPLSPPVIVFLFLHKAGLHQIRQKLDHYLKYGHGDPMLSISHANKKPVLLKGRKTSAVN